MPFWAAAGFNALGPLNDRAMRTMPLMQKMLQFMFNPNLAQMLKPDSWGARLYLAAERGEIAPEQCPSLLADDLGPSLDTTACATGSAI